MVAVTLAAPIIVIYNETGSSALGVLRSLISLTISDVFNDVGSLALKTIRSAQGMEHLLVDADRQILVRQRGAPDMWFLLDDDSLTFLSDDPDSEDVSLACRSLAAVLDETKLIPAGGVGSVPAERAFAAVTPGAIVADVFASAQGRGFLQGITLTGGASVDAAGDAWPEMVTRTWRAGVSVLDVVKQLADEGLIEWRFSSRALEIYRPGGGLDRTLTEPFKPGRDVKDAPYARSRRTVATDVLVEVSGGITAARTQSLTGRRRREAYVSQTSAPDTAADQVGDLYLAAHEAADVQISHTLTDGDATPRPWADYRCGDRVPTMAAGNGVTVERVLQITREWPDEESPVALEMGGLLRSAEEIFERQIRRLLPGDDAA